MMPESTFSSLWAAYTVSPASTGETLMPRLLNWYCHTLRPVRAFRA